MGRKKDKYRKKVTGDDLKGKIKKYFIAHSRKSLSAKQIASKLEVKKSVDSVKHQLEVLRTEGVLFRYEDGNYKLDSNYDTSRSDHSKGKSKGKNSNKDSRGNKRYIGTIDMTRSGSAFLLVDELDDDLHISPNKLNGAMNGDRVEVSAHFPKGRKRGEASVIKVVKRKISSVVGKIWLGKGSSVVDVLNSSPTMTIRVKAEDTLDAQDGDIVVTEITDWGTGKNSGIHGKVKRIIPPEDENEVSMQAILSMNGFDSFFPDEVEAEMANIPDEIPTTDLDDRRDFRETLTITIDPETAKDFDDAISYKKLEDGKVEIGVHIADVTHYLRPETALDREAYNRSTSVYLVDRCIPMLPEKLSNNLCSLMPHVDRLAFSAAFTFDKNLKIVDRWFGKAIIHSARRYSYEEAQEVIDTGKGDYPDELRHLNEIAKKLRAQRFKDGSINFDSEEVKFKLDEKGKPIDLYVKERKDTHLMIEDYMLLANKEVAHYIERKQQGKAEIPYVYRIHDEPNVDKLGELSIFAKEMGFKFEFDTPQQIKASINRLAIESKENEVLKLLEPLAIRSMAKAVYSTDNIGHFGLGFSHYAHFTSPIRRYADVLVHRVLYDNLKDTKRLDKEKLEMQCNHISTQEKKATEAERESIKYKQVEYMLDKVGEEFDAVISGMIERGIFVELPDSKAEGLIPFDKLGEAFELTNGRLKAESTQSDRKIRLGDKVRVKLIAANLDVKQLDFEMVS